MSSVRQATLDDKPAIAEFLKVAYPDRHRYKFPERWEWQFENNPLRDRNRSGNPNEGKLPIWLAFDGERIVGQTGAQVEPLKLGDKSVLVGWSVDTIVLPEYRRKGIGRRLQEANQSYHQVFMSLAMSDAQPACQGVAGRWRDEFLAWLCSTGELGRYQKVIHC